MKRASSSRKVCSERSKTSTTCEPPFLVSEAHRYLEGAGAGYDEGELEEKKEREESGIGAREESERGEAKVCQRTVRAWKRVTKVHRRIESGERGEERDGERRGRREERQKVKNEKRKEMESGEREEERDRE